MSQPATPPEEDHATDTLRTNLQSLAARLGKTPTVVDVHDAESQYHPKDYVDAFGSWENALQEAGLDPDDAKHKIPDHELLAELQRLYKDLGDSPTCDDMREHGEYSARLYKDRFGKWNNALQEAMLDTNDLNKEELLTDLQRVARDLDRIPTANEMREHGEHRPVTYHRRFGSWRHALAEADFSSMNP